MGKQDEQLCIKCGKPMPVGSRFCNHCGRDPTGASQSVQPNTSTIIYTNTVPYSNQTPPFSGFVIAGFITAILQLSPINLVFSIIGVQACKKYGMRGRGLGVFSIILSLLDILVATVILLAFVLVYAGMPITVFLTDLF